MKEVGLVDARKKIAQLASEYESKGYTVVRDAELPQLSKPFRNFRADLLARRGDETVVVEMKDLRVLRKEKFAQLAEEINNIPGWRFEVVFLKPKKEQTEESSELLSMIDLNKRLAMAYKFIQTEDFDLAFMVIWINLESVLRSLAARQGLKLKDPSIEYVLKKHLSHGLITKGTYQAFKRGLQFRNKLVHGYKVSTLYRHHVCDLIKIVSGLVDDLTKLSNSLKRKHASKS